uniref:Uncharacterized protein n=1 Tax=Rhizophora mucronata TaxID=61149 RepID=A0A2P2N823_RHIMU
MGIPSKHSSPNSKILAIRDHFKKTFSFQNAPALCIHVNKASDDKGIIIKSSFYDVPMNLFPTLKKTHCCTQPKNTAQCVLTGLLPLKLHFPKQCKGFFFTAIFTIPRYKT